MDNCKIDRSNFHSPIGLKIGDGKAEEIALGISTEIQFVYSKNL
jgi:xanthine/CO dehydrogenase XdhC/CoxF family maturation factor